MDKTTAIKIIESLADGVDSLTGEHFPNNGALQNAEVVRALYFALSIINGNRLNHRLPNEIGYDFFAKSEQEEAWQEYCEMVKYENPYHDTNTEEDEESDDVILDDEEFEEDYCEDDEPYDYYDKDYEDAMDDIQQEIYENMENYARSEEAGWYYPKIEGSWEDNLSDEE